MGYEELTLISFGNFVIKINRNMKIQFNRIFIIESLGSYDRKTGTELYNDP